jgi:hypothetical protein
MATGITAAPDIELFEALPIINLLMERVSRLRRSYRATFEFFVGNSILTRGFLQLAID